MTTKIKVQRFGRFLSNMVMPNIGAFIAWGLITALFIPTGWLPNATLAGLVAPMITYLLPLLIGYTGGKLVGGERGAVVGAVTTIGVIVSADIPMFLGAMLAGPLGGLAIKSFDRLIDGRIRSGFEMLVNNFSAGIIGAILALLAYLLIGPAVKEGTDFLKTGVNFLIRSHALPLTSIFVEPGKILFLNNAINHGIFTPLGTQQSQQLGHSIFFLIEANPGPGMGVLMAYTFFGRGTAKRSAPGAAIIHFFGGIHEIYFPYVLMNPRLLFSCILGGIGGVATLSLFDAGLVAPASPGSIFAVLLMTPKGQNIGVISAVAVAFLVSFTVSGVLLKTARNDEHTMADASGRIRSMKAQSQGRNRTSLTDCTTIYVACDAGMGSSATGASMLRNRLGQAGLSGIVVDNVAIDALPEDAKVIITHRDLTPRARQKIPGATHFSLSNFLDKGFYDGVVTRLKAAGSGSQRKADKPAGAAAKNAFTLEREEIFLGLTAANKEDVIRFAGERLVAGGYVEPEYVAAMLEREEQSSTYLDGGIAIPHGNASAKASVHKAGVVFCQYRDGVVFDSHGEKATLVVAIAANQNEHIELIAAITRVLDDDQTRDTLKTTTDVDEVLRILERS